MTGQNTEQITEESWKLRNDGRYDQLKSEVKTEEKAEEKNIFLFLLFLFSMMKGRRLSDQKDRGHTPRPAPTNGNIRGLSKIPHEKREMKGEIEKMSKRTSVKVELNDAGFTELLKSAQIKSALDNAANQIANSAGEGFDATPAENRGSRLVAEVSSTTKEAMERNAEENTLLKATGSVMGDYKKVR